MWKLKFADKKSAKHKFMNKTRYYQSAPFVAVFELLKVMKEVKTTKSC